MNEEKRSRELTLLEVIGVAGIGTVAAVVILVLAAPGAAGLTIGGALTALGTGLVSRSLRGDGNDARD